ncbi:TPA: SSU0592/SSU0593 family protein [Streptococcus suis]
MKRIVTKRSYKVGLCTMALALLMSTAGGVTAGAQDYHVESSGALKPIGNGTFMKMEYSAFPKDTPIENNGVTELKSVSSQNADSVNSSDSWFWNLWKKFKTVFQTFIEKGVRRGFGIQRLFGFK